MALTLSELLNWSYEDQKQVLNLIGLNELVALSTLPSLDKRKNEYDESSKNWDEWFKSTPTWMHGK